MVLEVADEAAWRMGEGLVGCGVRFGRDSMEAGLMKEREVLGGSFGWESMVDRVGWERTAAADLDISVDGPFDNAGFLTMGWVCGLGVADRAARVFWYFSSAARRFSMLAVHSISIHSGSCTQGSVVLSQFLSRVASAIFSASSCSFRRFCSCRS